MTKFRVATLAAILPLVCGSAPRAMAQGNEEAPAITARVHGTFVDEAGGLGVLSGDLSVVRFEARGNTVTAIGQISGALADGTGKVLGQVAQELALPVGNVDSTCNQLRMDLAAADVEVLGVRVHLDRETAGFDSRDGATPRALGVMCAAAEVLRGKPAPAAVAQALERIARAVRARASR